MTLDLPFTYEFDHIGIAVNSIEEGSQFYKSLGFAEAHIEEVPTENVKVAMYKLENSSKIELLEPTSEKSAIHGFLQKRGPGIHHICLRVKDLQSTLDRLADTEIRLLDKTPRPGAHGCQVAFIHPKSAGGVLVELSQPGQ